MSGLVRFVAALWVLVPAFVLAEISVGPGQQEVMGELGGIPMHRVSVETRAHDDVDIRVDGVVEEYDWQTVPYYDNLLGNVPFTGKPGEYPTQIRMLATEKGLYVSAVLYQPPETINHRYTKRDAQGDRDTFGVTIDSTGTGAFAYWFILSASGTVQDGKVLPERRYSSVWDGTWEHKTATFDEGWSAELFFPWSMMTLPPTDAEGNRNVGFAFSRRVSHKNQRLFWPGHPYSAPQFVTALNSMELGGIEQRPLIQVIPYASAIDDSARDDKELRAGIEATWKPSAAAEITVSANPDFGAVEADSVVLNLTALEAFFPEKRLFFLEGNEIFETSPRTDTGKNMREAWNEDFSTASRQKFITDNLAPPISLINTRRIGGTATQVTLPAGVSPLPGERDLPTELMGALKFKGQLGNFQYGMLGAFEDDVEWYGRNAAGQPVDITGEGRDFSALRLLHETTGDHRVAVGYLGTRVSGPLYDATVHGVDWHYATGDGKWTADVQLIDSDVANVSGNGVFAEMSYAASSSAQHRLQLDWFDEDVDINDLGFLVRNDITGLQYIFNYAHRDGEGLVKRYRGSMAVRQMYNVSKGQVVDSSIAWRNLMELSGRNTVRSVVAYMPERYEDVDSRGNGAYRADGRWWMDVQLATDASKVFSWTVSAGGWQEDLGDWTRQLTLGTTWRPSDSLSVDLDVKYKRRDGWLVYQGGNNFGAFEAIDWQPALEFNWFMSAEHQFRLSLQWAGVRAVDQAFYAVPAGDGELVPAARVRPNYDFTVSLLTTQLRYRWEIAPLTDLFVVYNRANRLPYRPTDSFSSLFSDSFDDPLVDTLVVKFRYRFSN